eukprot:15459432-Alexandrium_andersonii.AAC.1
MCRGLALSRGTATCPSLPWPTASSLKTGETSLAALAVKDRDSQAILSRPVLRKGRLRRGAATERPWAPGAWVAVV